LLVVDGYGDCRQLGLVLEEVGDEIGVGDDGTDREVLRVESLGPQQDGTADFGGRVPVVFRGIGHEEEAARGKESGGEGERLLVERSIGSGGRTICGVVNVLSCRRGELEGEGVGIESARGRKRDLAMRRRDNKQGKAEKE